MPISIIGIDKAKLLLILYNKANCQGENFNNSPMTKRIGILSAKNKGKMELAEKIIDESQDYIFDNVDLGAGSRPLKISLDGFEIDTSSYDHYHGKGRGESAVQEIIADMLNQAPASQLQGIMELGNIEKFDEERSDNKALAMIRKYTDSKKSDADIKRQKTSQSSNKM